MIRIPQNYFDIHFGTIKIPFLEAEKFVRFIIVKSIFLPTKFLREKKNKTKRLLERYYDIANKSNTVDSIYSIQFIWYSLTYSHRIEPFILM